MTRRYGFGLQLLVVVFVSAGLAHSQTPDAKKHVVQEDRPGAALPAQSAVPMARAQDKCIVLPPAPEDDDSLGSGGMSGPLRRCEVIEFRPLADAAPGWTVARYRWTSAKPAADPSPRSAPSDVRTAEEVVLFDTPMPGKVRPIWHDRFSTGEDAVWRSVTPEAAPARGGSTLLSVMYCVNGTGGCGQEFLRRNRNRSWTGIRQAWLDQLPSGFRGRIRHGSRIDPHSLRAEAGFYGDGDPNCCPSETLFVELALRGNSLVLVHHSVAARPEK
ncbi:MAG TPA: hypothetical protein VHQ48_08485 [Bradyrhizobium sp.]|nr:hypothetical protein [Bradyrhizobium sp.]